MTCSYKFGGFGMRMITYCTPTSPGRSRLFYCLVADKQAAPAALKRTIGLKPDWLTFLNHFQRNLVLDGDSIFLHKQVGQLQAVSLLDMLSITSSLSSKEPAVQLPRYGLNPCWRR